MTRPTARILSNDEVVKIVSRLLNVDHSLIMQKYKHCPPHVFDAQITCMYILRFRENVTTTEMRDYFMKANHSSISLGIKAFKDLLSYNKYFRQKVSPVLEHFEYIYTIYESSKN